MKNVEEPEKNSEKSCTENIKNLNTQILCVEEK